MVSSGRGVGCPQSPQSFCQPHDPDHQQWMDQGLWEETAIWPTHTFLSFFLSFSVQILCAHKGSSMVCMWRSKDNVGCGSPTTPFLVEEGSPSVCQAWFAMRTDQQAPKYIPVNSSYLIVVALKWQINAITSGFYIHSGDWSLSLHTCKTRALSTKRVTLTHTF